MAYIVTGEVVDVGLRKHGVICRWPSILFQAWMMGSGRPTLELALAEGRGVAGDDDKLGFA